MFKIIAILAMLVSLFHVESSYAKNNQPIYGFCNEEGETYYCHYDASEHVWIDRSTLKDMWVTAGRYDSPESYAYWLKARQGDRIPVKKVYQLKLAAVYRHPEHIELAMAAATLVRKDRPRAVIINVEGGDWPEESKVWPHLGIMYVGTVAKQEGYDVVLYDELIEGRKPLKQLVRRGDIVGLSLVTTGIERGVEVAREAKRLGARYVIAGNDSAMFRARQLLELPNQPIDAVFTSNSIVAIREFFRNADAVMAGDLNVPHVATNATDAPFLSNAVGGVSHDREPFTAADYFLVPELSLFGRRYWGRVRKAYRSQFGHKHRSPRNVRNAIALLAQGCGRAGAGAICQYCTISEVESVILPPDGYLEETLAAYKGFGVNTFFNVTDSSFEMGKLALALAKAGRVDTLVLYGRAQAIGGKQGPQLLRWWKECVHERLLINCGMDSGDERILTLGIDKSSSKVGSRLAENYQALANIKAAGPKVHLHFSVIFGSPGETQESCRATLGFVKHAIDTLGEQLDVVEGDSWWLNFGAPCAEVFTSYEAAERRAALAGKTITPEEWNHYFARHADELVVPHEAQSAWYTFFTGITLEEAYAYNDRVREMAAKVPGRIAGREFAFKPPTI